MAKGFSCRNFCTFIFMKITEWEAQNVRREKRRRKKDGGRYLMTAFSSSSSLAVSFVFFLSFWYNAFG